MKRHFVINEFYHIFNRGVEKREIFFDKSDKIRFVHDLYEFNDTKPASVFVRRFDLSSNDVGCRTSHIRDRLVNLHTFNLMPNHYHLLVEPIRQGGISLFMKKLQGGYTNGTNIKYKRSGHLFQGPFKHVRIEDDSQLSHLVCYIHANSLDFWKPGWKETGLTDLERQNALKFLENEYRWSSHRDYLGNKNFPSLISTDFLFKFFGGPQGYNIFFNNWLKQYETNIQSIQKFLLE